MPGFARATEPFFFGLKGRFCQPRPKAWAIGVDSGVGPERAVRLATRQMGMIRLSKAHSPNPGLRPELTKIGPSGRKIGSQRCPSGQRQRGVGRPPNPGRGPGWLELRRVKIRLLSRCFITSRPASSSGLVVRFGSRADGISSPLSVPSPVRCAVRVKGPTLALEWSPGCGRCRPGRRGR